MIRQFSKIPRRYSLRTLLAIVTLIAVVYGWIILPARRQAEAARWMQDHFGSVGYDDLVDSDTGVQTPRGPAWARRIIGDAYFRNVVAVRVEKGIRPEELREVLQFPRLTSLHFQMMAYDDSRIPQELIRDRSRYGRRGLFTDEHASIVARIATLERLVIEDDSLSDVGLKSIASLPRLEELRFEGTSVTDDGLACLVTMPKLRRLTICSYRDSLKPRFTDKGLAQIGKITGLSDLELEIAGAADGSRFFCLTDNAFAGLASSKSLQSLTIRNSRIEECSLHEDGEGLARLRALTSLRRLNLDRVEHEYSGSGIEWAVDESDLWELGSMPFLESLKIMGVVIDDDSIPVFAQFPNLKQLEISGTSVTAEGRAHLQALLPECKIHSH